MNSHEHGDYHLVIDRVRLSLIQLHNINCHIAIGWIPAHSGIYYNEQADTLAKYVLKANSVSTNGQLSLPVCKKMVSAHIRKLWQQRWDRCTTGRATHELIRTVGKPTVFPSDRCSAISYCRLLLDDSTLKVHQIRAGLAQSTLCDCGYGVDDVQHFFFECNNYEAIRRDLTDWVQSVLSSVDYQKRPQLSTSLLLAPRWYEQISNRVSFQILGSTFECIKNFKRRL